VNTLLLGSFFVLLALRFPIAVALGLSCALGLALAPSVSAALIAQRMFVAIDSFPLTAVPLYLFAGYLMSAGGISRRIVVFAASLVGGVRAGLAHVGILSSLIFSGVSGSSVAETAAIGTIMIPEMRGRGYRASFATAVIAVASTLGIIIPPSIPMVIVGDMLGISVGRLFLGGLVPGLLIGAGLAVAVYLSGERGDDSAETFRWSAASASLKNASWALLMPVLVVAGIVSGACTATEAGAVAVVYAFAISVFLYRETTPAELRKALTETALSTARVFFVIAAAGLFSWLLTVNGFPETVSDSLQAVTHSPRLTLAAVAAILLLVTMFMESIATMVLLLPVLDPLARQAGVDPIHFGVVTVVCVGIGLATPPVGLCLFVACDVGHVGVWEASKAAAPLLAVMLGLLAVLIFVPDLSTALPRWVMG